MTQGVWFRKHRAGRPTPTCRMPAHQAKRRLLYNTTAEPCRFKYSRSWKYLFTMRLGGPIIRVTLITRLCRRCNSCVANIRSRCACPHDVITSAYVTGGSINCLERSRGCVCVLSTGHGGALWSVGGTTDVVVFVNKIGWMGPRLDGGREIKGVKRHSLLGINL